MLFLLFFCIYSYINKNMIINLILTQGIIMKKLLFLLLITVPTLGYAEYVASIYEKKLITYIAEVGATVKKGGILYTMDEDEQIVLLETNKLLLEKALASLQVKKADIKRAENLISKKSISLATYENAVVEFYKCLMLSDRQKCKIKQSKIVLKCMTFKAPYDCKVVRHLVCTNSGTDYGTHILEIQPLNEKSKDLKYDSKKSGTMQFTSSLSGESIVYIPEENQTVKKGELLLKFDTCIIDLELKSLKASLKEAKELLKDAKSDFNRSKKLAKSRVISQKEHEDISFIYKKSVINVNILALEIEHLKDEIEEHFTVQAPYDLKVVKRILCVGSGVKVGRPILEVQKL